MKLRLELNVIKSAENESRFALVLHNLSEQDIHDWQLLFAVTRYVVPESVSKGNLNQVGTLCTYSSEESILANNHIYLEYSHFTKPFTLLDEGISGAALRHTVNGNVTVYPIEISPINLASPSPQRVSLNLPSAKEINLIPQPKALVETRGYFLLNDDTAVSCDHEEGKQASKWLIEELSQHLRQPVSFKQDATICLIHEPSMKEGEYKISATTDKVNLYSADHAGFIYACATLLQLIPNIPSHRHLTAYQIPCVEIEDHPRYSYRGMMLDCARHFHPIERIKGLINQLARFKFNYFHWHLTDDEGWRVEIDAYPELTEIGAWRGPFETLEPQYTAIDKIHGGFYTKKDIQDVIQFAQERGITIIPEIDIPGHSRAAIKSLPHLLIEPEDHSQYRSIQHFTDNILNPGLTSTYTFLETVFDEICELFPGRYVHVGGDEVPKGVWKHSPACQKLKNEQGYDTEEELQGHLLRHIEEYLKAKGKKMMGWEEAIHCDKVSRDTTIFAWINQESALNCIKKGYPTIMQPGQDTYLDMAQEYSSDEPGTDWACKIPLEKAYHFEPFSQLPLDPEFQMKIKGIQCALWSELTHSMSRFEYMIYPRLLAIAEVCWSAKEQRDWHDFQARLSGQLQYLDRLGINYRR